MKKIITTLSDAKSTAARKILVVSRCEGYVHKSIPLGMKALQLMGGIVGCFLLLF